MLQCSRLRQAGSGIAYENDANVLLTCEMPLRRKGLDWWSLNKRRDDPSSVTATERPVSGPPASTRSRTS